MAKYIKVRANDNDIEYEKINDSEVRFHRRWKKQYGATLRGPGDNFSHYHGTINIPEKVTDVKGEIGPKGKVYTVSELGKRSDSVDDGAFSYGAKVEEVSVPGTVKTIFHATFWRCVNLHKVTLNEGVEIIEDQAFQECFHLDNITIPDSVVRIGYWAFHECQWLTEITLSKKLCSAYDSFRLCKRIKKITCRAVEPPKLNGKSFENEVYANAELFVPGNSIEKYKTAPYWKNFKRISYYDNPPTPVTQDTPKPDTQDTPKPNTVDTPKPNTVDTPKPNTVDTPKPNTVDTPTPDTPKYLIIKDGDNDIKYQKESDNEVKLVGKSSSIMTLFPYGYLKSRNFSSYHGTIIIPESVTDVNGEIGPKGKVYTVTKLGADTEKEFGAFVGGQNVQEVSVPGTVKELYHNTFNGCTNLHKVTLHEGIEKISGSKMDHLYIKYDCDGGAFLFCQSLQEITLPDSLTIIGNKAFKGCTSLTEITLGKNIETLSRSFLGCHNIRKVTCRAVEPPKLNEAFEEDAVSNAELFVPGASLEKYKSAPIWQNFKKISSYDNPPKLDTVDTPKSEQLNFMESGINYWVKDANAKVVYVTNKPRSKYKDIITIPQMVLHEGVTYQVLKIGNYAFNGCKALTAVSIPNTVKGINDFAFADTPQLKTINCYATTPPEVKPKSLDGVLFDKITLYVPKDAVAAYRSADGWKNFVNILPLDS